MKKFNLNKDQACLVISKENKFYLSLYNSTYCYILLLDNEKYFFTDNRYYEEAKKKLKDFKVVLISKTPLIDILNILKLYSIKELKVEIQKLLYPQFLEIKEVFKDYNITDCTDDFAKLRLQKSDYEIKNIKKAIEISHKAFIKLINEDIKENITERELAAKLEYYMKSFGATEKSFDTICAFGKNTSIPHHGISDKKLKNHDLITIDFGCIYNGYMSDTTRTFGFGKLDDEIRKSYNIVLENNLLMTDLVREGVKCKDLNDESVKHLLKYFDKSAIKHSLGHGVGIEIHENPFLSTYSNEILQENQIVTIEPGIYLKNYGIRIEDMILVAKNDKIKLSNIFKNKLIEI